MLMELIYLAMGIFIFANAYSESTFNERTNDVAFWRMYKAAYSKHYETFAEDYHHMQIFLNEIRAIEIHNRNYEIGKSSFKMGFNEFSDMQHDEFNETQNYGFESSVIPPHGFGRAPPINDNTLFYLPWHLIKGIARLPEEIDWREHGVVTGVKKQGKCLCCWALSTLVVGALEAQNYFRTGHLKSLSAQFLVDCTKNRTGDIPGCKGGKVSMAYNFVKNNGVKTEAEYPYRGRAARCPFKIQENDSILGYAQLPYGDEETLAWALAIIGPVVTVMDASHSSFMRYEEGIYHEPRCHESKINHSVLLVGYGIDEYGQKYYIAKNTFGPEWGEDGYFRIARNHNNHCSIASYPSYPI